MAIYQDDKLVKRAFRKITYTPEQVDELRKCMDPVTGPEYFIANFMYVQHATRGREKIVLYDYQKELLHNYHRYRKSINMMARQTGKCVTGDTTIRVRNDTTGEIKSVTMEEFNRMIGEKE